MKRLTPDQWQLVEKLFERELSDDCASLEQVDDPTLRRYLDRLVAAANQPHPLFQSDLSQLLNDLGPSLPDHSTTRSIVGRHFGPYVTTEVIGRGGMGTVALAERADGQFEKQVAVKVVNAAYDPSLRRRFQQEMRTLARLDHSGIVGFLDGGLTDDGMPYFVMEYCQGQRVDQWCDQRALGLQQRMQLVMQLCEAVDYAHRNLIVHRDLKPSNVLVDQAGVVKIVDFGVAKTLDQLEADDGVQTRVFTPGYAAPEQLTGAAVTTATDVYALSILLGELVLGPVPDHAELVGASGPSSPLDLWRRQWRGWRQHPHCQSLARQRACSPERLAALLQGDLRYILQQGLASDPLQRYARARDLADDINRHLQHMPLSSRPRSLVHAGVRFARRHVVGVALGAVTTLAIVGGAGAALWQAQRAAAAAEQATAEATRATAVTQFLQSIFDGVDPWLNQRQPVTADTLMDQAIARVGSELVEHPAVQGEVLISLGDILSKLGRLEQARELLQRAVELLRDQGQQDVLMTALGELAELDMLLENFATSESLLREGIALADLTPLTSTKLKLRFVLARLLGESLGRTEDAAPILQRLERHRTDIENLPDGISLSADLDLAHAFLAQSRGRYRPAAEYALKAAAGYRTSRGPQHASVANALSEAATAYYALDEGEKSKPIEQEALAIFRKVYGDEHPFTLSLINDIGATLSNEGRLAEARVYYQQALDGWLTIYGDQHSYTGTAWRNLAQIDRLLGDYAAAEQSLLKALATGATSGERGHIDALTEALYARLLSEQGRLGEAQTRFEAGLVALAQSVGEDHPLYLRILVEYAAHLIRQQRWAQAKQALQAAHPALQAAYGEGAVYPVLAAAWLGVAKAQSGEPDARDWLQDAHQVLAAVPARYRIELAAISAAQALLAAKGCSHAGDDAC